MRLAHSRIPQLAILFASAATAACGDGGTDPSRAAVKLGLAVAPAGAPSGIPFQTQPVIQLLGADGRAVEERGVAVTAAVQGAPLVGTATATTNGDGRAVFTNLGIGGPATTRTIVFTSPNLQPVSQEVTVSAGPAARLAAATPVAQSAVVSSPVTARPAVTATDLAGNAVAGVAVTFAVTSGGGTLTGASQVTGGDGRATVESWTLGSAVGPNTVSASAPGLEGSPVSFSATALLLAPTLFRANAGNGQSAPVGGAVAIPPSVIVTGVGGVPVPEVPVTFTITEGSGQVTGATPVTNADGIATLGSWVLGPGVNRLVAASPGIAGSPVTFSATGTESGRMSAHDEPPARAGLVSTVLVPAPAVRVTTPAGSPLAGVSVTFAVASGGGSVTGATQVTNGSGIAAVGSWRLGAAVGANELTASAGPGYTGSPVTFTALAVAQLPDQITISAGNGQTATVGTPVPVRPAVRITAAGAPVAGYPVSFQTSDGTITGGNVSTGADGIATVGSWVLGQSPGPQELRVTTAFGSVTFTATARAGTPSTLFTDPGFVADGVVGREPETLPAVQVTDQFGNPLAGIEVRFAVAQGGGSVNTAPRLTDAVGITRPSGWRLGTTVGLNTLTATVTGLPPVTLRAQARADAPALIEIVDGQGQTGGVNRDLPVDPSVKVEDQYGNAAIGLVRFTVQSGGGSGGGEVNSDATTGLASVRWRLGPSPGPNSLRATLVPTGTAVTFTATAVAVTSSFDIELQFLGTVSADQRAAFDAAVARWRDIILGDLSSLQLNAPAGDCFESQPAVNRAVDDVLILVEIAAIDGPGGVLGSAGPCVLRSGSLLPAMGAMRFDQADVAAMQQSGEFGDVILHEMAHVFGLGTIWQARGLLTGASGSDPRFIGLAARQGYVAVGGPAGSTVPVEAGGGAGTALAHWRESVFRTELMTGFIGGPPNPLSRVTIGSLQDLGYVVDYGTADPFSLAAALQRLGPPPRHLRERPLAGQLVVAAPDGTIIQRRARPR